MYTCPDIADVNQIDTRLVATDTDLASALAPLAHLDYLALDTEFMRERTYWPQLCLIQVANAAGCVLVDPFTVTRLEPLTELLADRSRTKILHAARQDIEVLQLATGCIPAPIFDTQIAASLLGLPAQIGYGELVRRRLGSELVKGHARTDWARRPLHEDQLAYAADDVRYLVPLYAQLCRDLVAAGGRLDWLFEETRALENPALYETMPADAWRRLRGLDRLRPVQRAVARTLAEWRESLARQSDKPRGWILTDEILRVLVERLPSSVEALAAIPGLPAATARKRGAELIERIRTAMAGAPDGADAVRPTRPDPEQVQRVGQLMKLVRTTAESNQIAPELLATRRDVERFVFSGDPGALARGWRYEVLGRRLLEVERT